MASGNGFCPVEGCPRNSGGICNAGMPVLAAYASNAVNMGGGFLAPFTPAALPLGIDAMGLNDPDSAQDGERWRNCHYYRERDLRK